MVKVIESEENNQYWVIITAFFIIAYLFYLTDINDVYIYLFMSVFSQNSLKNKLALISGGGTGICFGISKQLLLHGARVYIISRKIKNVGNGVERLKKESGK